MARRKKKTETDSSKTAAFFDLVGGPRGGQKIRLVNPPPPFIRLAFPTWCTYEWDEKEKAFKHIGNKPVPAEVYSAWAGYHPSSVKRT